jgi:putative ABC transport system substrate-binding protein
MSANFVEGARTPFIGNICYGVSSPAVIRRSASFVHNILRGARPNDLPVEQPTVFDFAVNLDMSRKIGLAIPTSIIAQATVVIDHDIRAPKDAN